MKQNKQLTKDQLIYISKYGQEIFNNGLNFYNFREIFEDNKSLTTILKGKDFNPNNTYKIIKSKTNYNFNNNDDLSGRIFMSMVILANILHEVNQDITPSSSTSILESDINTFEESLDGIIITYNNLSQ